MFTRLTVGRYKISFLGQYSSVALAKSCSPGRVVETGAISCNIAHTCIIHGTAIGLTGHCDLTVPSSVNTSCDNGKEIYLSCISITVFKFNNQFVVCKVNIK